MSHPIAIGTVLEVLDHSRVTNQFVVEGYNEEKYMKMTMMKNPSVFMTIHPAHAERIATKGNDSGIKVLNAHNLSDVIVKVTEAIVAVPKPITAGNAATGSKKERALALKAANPNATRKDLIAMFVEQLGMTPAGASTYASMKG